jgi:hypothetical protein
MGNGARMVERHNITRLEAIMAKAITTTTNLDAMTVTFSFQDGHAITATTIGLDATIIDRLALHGLKQKLADAMAIPCDTVTGKSASLTDKRQAAEKVWNNLLEGSWGITREGSGEPKGGYLFTALVELYQGKKTVEDVQKFLAGCDKKKQAALREDKRVKPIIDRLKAERAKATDIDTDELLAGLED